MTLIQWVIELLDLPGKQIFNELHLACLLQESLWKRKQYLFVCHVFMMEGIKKSTVTMNFFTIQKFQSRLPQITFCLVICGGKKSSSINFQKCIYKAYLTLLCFTGTALFTKWRFMATLHRHHFSKAFAPFMSLSHFGNSCN